MKPDTIKTAALVLAAGLAALYLLKKKDLVTGAAAGAVGVVADVAAGTVQGIGSLFGVPTTDAARCAQAQADGSLWGQSLYCPATTYLSGAWQTASTKAGEAVQEAAAVVGVPRTNMTECDRAKAEGRTLDASFACPAGDFLSYLFR